MKKKLAVAAAFCLIVLAVSACAAGGNTQMQKKLVEKGIEMTEQMDEMAESDVYVRVMSASSGLADVISEMGGGEYGAPLAAFEIFLPETAYLTYLVGMEEDMTQLSSSMQQMLILKAYAAAPNQVNAHYGAEALAGAACVTASDALILKGLNQPVLYLIQYAGGYSSMVSFLPGEDGAVFASAAFVKGDGLQEAQSEADIAAWLNETIYYEGGKVTRVPLPAA